MDKQIAEMSGADADFRLLTDMEVDTVGGGFWGLPDWASTALLIGIAVALALA